MLFENAGGTAHRRTRHRQDYVPEAPRPGDGRVEGFASVRGGDDQDVAPALEAFEFGRQAGGNVIVGARQGGAAWCADAVDFVEENDDGRVRIGLSGGTRYPEHFAIVGF